MLKKQELVSTLSEEARALANASFPKDPGYARVSIPRINFVSQDKTETVVNPKTKKKEVKLVAEAGTFSRSVPTDVINEDTGKKEWEQQEIGIAMQAIVIFARKQLRHYDGASWINSSMYDDESDIIPLFKDGAEIARGTAKELQAMPEFDGTDRAGKPKSKLEENKVIFLMFKLDEDSDYALHQLTVRGSSMFSFKDYTKKVTPSTVLTEMSSVGEKNGAIEWNKITFKAVRELSQDEFDTFVAPNVASMQEDINRSKEFFAKKAEEDAMFSGEEVKQLGS